MATVDFYPNKQQQRFLRSTKRHCAYGGARGGGKSWVVRLDSCINAKRYPGIKLLIIRSTFRELDNNHIQPLINMLGGIAKYNRQDKRFTFQNGSTISFGYCASDADLTQYQGAEYDIIYIDEATNLKEEWIQRIIACNRGTNGFPKYMRYTCNPGGVGHQYIKRLFVDRRFKGAENPEEYEFIQAKVTDNKALMESDPEYIKQLQNLPPKLREAWLNGSWNIFEGQVFEEFRVEPDLMMASRYGFDDTAEELLKQRRFTHVIKPFKVPDTWELYRSFDWGYRHPFSMGYWAVDYDGTIYRIAQFYGVQHSGGDVLPNEGLKWTPDRVFSEIQRYEHEMWPNRTIHGVADPAIWDAETGVSCAETAVKYGIFFAKGDHQRIPGWMQVHYRMQFDEEGYPQMYVFDTCHDFIRTMPLLQYDDHKVEDIDTEGEDHIADEVRYFCMTRPIKPVLVDEPYYPQWGSDPLQQFGRR